MGRADCKRHSRRRGAGVLAACALALAAPSPAPAAQAPPSFLHILTDDQTIDSLRYMPNLERLLKRRGTNFTNYHAVQPLCCPSRASFLTGQYPHNHGVLTNTPPNGGYEGMDFSRTLYTALDDAGYRTGWVGKVLNSRDDVAIEPEPGFDEWFTPLGATELDMFDYTVSDNGTERRYTGPYQNDVFAARAQRFLRQGPKKKPFMLTLALTSPHWSRCYTPDPVFGNRCPPQPSPGDLGSFEGYRFPFGPGAGVTAEERAKADEYWQRELESLQSVDGILKALIGELRDSGRLANTYVIFQSDNGSLHGEHGIFDKNVPWDRSVRVPLLIRGPGFDKGRRRTDLTANVDVPATILDAAGVREPLPADGYSLLGRHRRRFLLMEKLVGANQVPKFAPWRQIKTADNWTYWRRMDGSGKRYLFDLDRDPYQLHNRINRDPKLADELEQKLRKVYDCANPCP